jgi:hypothetical protein
MEAMGAGSDTPLGKVEDAFERVHARTADAIGAAGRMALEQVDRVRRRARASPGMTLAASVVLGMIIGRLTR